MDYYQFKKEWLDEMVYKVEYEDLEQDINDAYTMFKQDKMNLKTVKKWCEFFYFEYDLDKHPYMLKMEALKTKHGNSLRKSANRYLQNKLN